MSLSKKHCVVLIHITSQAGCSEQSDLLSGSRSTTHCPGRKEGRVTTLWRGNDITTAVTLSPWISAQAIQVTGTTMHYYYYFAECPAILRRHKSRFLARPRAALEKTRPVGRYLWHTVRSRASGWNLSAIHSKATGVLLQARAAMAYTTHVRSWITEAAAGTTIHSSRLIAAVYISVGIASTVLVVASWQLTNSNVCQDSLQICTFLSGFATLPRFCPSGKILTYACDEAVLACRQETLQACFELERGGTLTRIVMSA